MEKWEILFEQDRESDISELSEEDQEKFLEKYWEGYSPFDL